MNYARKSIHLCSLPGVVILQAFLCLDARCFNKKFSAENTNYKNYKHYNAQNQRIKARNNELQCTTKNYKFLHFYF